MNDPMSLRGASASEVKIDTEQPWGMVESTATTRMLRAMGSLREGERAYVPDPELVPDDAATLNPEGNEKQ